MSDPVTNIEIEDVLSSIRKLVSENTRSEKDVDAANAVPEKLVLTPSLRVEEPEEDVFEETDAVADVVSEEDTLHLDNAARIEGELAANEEANSPEKDGDVTVEDTNDTLEQSIETYAVTAEDIKASPEVKEAHVQGLRALEPFFTYTNPEHDATNEADFDADQPSDVYAENPQDTPQNSLEARMAQVTSVLKSRQQSPNTQQDAYEEDDAYLSESAPREDAVDEDDMQAPDAFGDNDFAPEDSLPKDEWESVSFSASEAATRPDNTIPFTTITTSPSMESDAGLDAELDAIVEDAAEPAKMPEVSALDDAILDEETLRELVSELVREELQGALGERITRNVRKLVRREIHRALSSLELE